jgi:hypothetical protein
MTVGKMEPARRDELALFVVLVSATSWAMHAPIRVAQVTRPDEGLPHPSGRANQAAGGCARDRQRRRRMREQPGKPGGHVRNHDDHLYFGRHPNRRGPTPIRL